MKRALVKSALLGVPFGALMGYLFSLDNPVAQSVLIGFVIGGGITFGFAGYSVWKQRRFNAWAARLWAPYEAEGSVQHCYAVAGETGNAIALAAIFVIGGRAARFDAGGVLILTGQRLLFVPHTPNRFTTRLDVPLADILGVGPGYGLSGKTIILKTRAGVTLHFKVDAPAKWIAALPGVKLPAPGTSPRRQAPPAPPAS